MAASRTSSKFVEGGGLQYGGRSGCTGGFGAPLIIILPRITIHSSMRRGMKLVLQSSSVSNSQLQVPVQTELPTLRGGRHFHSVGYENTEQHCQDLDVSLTVTPHTDRDTS